MAKMSDSALLKKGCCRRELRLAMEGDSVNFVIIDS
jgi:hypothetical protein